MVAWRDTARDLHVEEAVAEAVPAHQLGADQLEAAAGHRHVDAQLAQRALQAIEVQVFVDQSAVRDRHHLVDAVGKLIATILDMNRGPAVRLVSPIDVGVSWHATSDACGPPSAPFVRATRTAFCTGRA